MKNKKGFTLVELLAVIAILAILVIIALPNVMGMFNEAKKNSFTTELKEIYKVSQQQWMMDSMVATDKQVYSRCATCSGKSLQLSGRTELDYYIVINKAGNVTKFYATDGTYQFAYNAGNLLATYINNVQPVSELPENEILKIENDKVINVPPTLITFTIKEYYETYNPSTGYYILDNNTKNYQAEEDMTFADWLNSSYNVDNVYYGDGVTICGGETKILSKSYDAHDGPNRQDVARYSEKIQEGSTYHLIESGSCEN